MARYPGSDVVGDVADRLALDAGRVYDELETAQIDALLTLGSTRQPFPWCADAIWRAHSTTQRPRR
ncbi:hypothetical protein ACETU7_33355 [Rhodococcus sp. 3Y1]